MKDNEASYMRDDFKKTILCREWLEKNKEAIYSLFPDQWTPIDKMGILPIAFKLKLIGISWSKESELIACIEYFEQLGFVKHKRADDSKPWGLENTIVMRGDSAVF